MLQVYYKRMPSSATDQELEVAELETTTAQPDARAVKAKSFPRRLAASHRSQMPVIVWLILSGIWGSTWLFIKLGLEDLPPLRFAGIRFLIAFTVLAAVVAVRRLPLPRKRSDWGIIAITGFLSFTLNYGLLFWGEQHVSSGLASMLQ